MDRVPGGCLAKRACGAVDPATKYITSTHNSLPGSVLIKPLPFDSQEVTLMHILLCFTSDMNIPKTSILSEGTVDPEPTETYGSGPTILRIG